MLKNEITINGIFTYNQHWVAMMNIINRSRLCPPKAGHKHHIIPRCWFKLKNLDVDNSDKNLVLLSYEDHVKVHKLMYLCTSGQMKRNMAFAYHRLTEGEIVENGCMKGGNAPNFGNKHSDETRRKMSASLKGRTGYWKGKERSEETKHKISESHKGLTHSDDTRKKMSAAMKGEKNPNFGKPHSDETRRKMSASRKGRTPWTKGKSWKLVNGKRIYSESKK